MLSKEQLLGYLVMTGKELKLTDDDLRKLIYTLEDELEKWTEEYAELVFNKWKKGGF